MKVEIAMSIILQYGKYKGRILDSVPSNYLKWASKNFNNDTIATAADVLWQWRDDMNCHI